MPRYAAGEEISYRITWLEMTAPAQAPGPLPEGLALIRSESPPWWWFLSLYDAVGRDHAWTDRHADAPEALGAWLADPRLELWVLFGKGWPQGFFLLDRSEAGICDLAYFGLVPEAVGQGLGTWFLAIALHEAWSGAGVEKVTVNTCSLDHPRALAQYRRFGFAPLRSSTATRILTRDLVLETPPL